MKEFEREREKRREREKSGREERERKRENGIDRLMRPSRREEDTFFF